MSTLLFVPVSSPHDAGVVFSAHGVHSCGVVLPPGTPNGETQSSRANAQITVALCCFRCYAASVIVLHESDTIQWVNVNTEVKTLTTEDKRCHCHTF